MTKALSHEEAVSLFGIINLIFGKKQPYRKHTHTERHIPSPLAPFSTLLCICLPATKVGEMAIQTIRNS